MSKYLTAEERCRRDPTYAAVINALEHLIHNLDLTPAEVREAATLACLRFEERRPQRFLYDAKTLRAKEVEFPL